MATGVVVSGLGFVLGSRPRAYVHHSIVCFDKNLIARGRFVSLAQHAMEFGARHAGHLVHSTPRVLVHSAPCILMHTTPCTDPRRKKHHWPACIDVSMVCFFSFRLELPAYGVLSSLHEKLPFLYFPSPLWWFGPVQVGISRTPTRTPNRHFKQEKLKPRQESWMTPNGQTRGK